MFTLEELLDVVNFDTLVNVVDANTGELYVEGSADDLEMAKDINGNLIYDFSLDALMDCSVMDINVWNNTLTICIDREQEDEEDERDSDNFDWDWYEEE